MRARITGEPVIVCEDHGEAFHVVAPGSKRRYLCGETFDPTKAPVARTNTLTAHVANAGCETCIDRMCMIYDGYSIKLSEES